LFFALFGINSIGAAATKKVAWLYYPKSSHDSWQKERMSVTRVRLGGLLLLLLSAGIFVGWGSVMERTAVGGMGDFKGVYYGTRCLLGHCDPYSVSELESFYRANGWKIPTESLPRRQGATLYVNMPTSFFFIAPFAMQPWGSAHVLWMIVTAGSLILAGFLMWNLGSSYAPNVSLFLICILLANCEIVYASGNTAGIVVGLCVVGAWCFLKGRFVPVGVLCMAASLAIKPHDAGLVWLFFLLAGGVYRKRALQTAAVTAVLGLVAVVWVSHVAPRWMPEQRANLVTITNPGSINDPGPANVHGTDPNTVIGLQTILSVFRNDSRIYNPVTYFVCGALLLLWSARTLRSRFSPESAWIALAAVVPLTMLVTYHRPYDAKLLLLTVPACAILWAEGGLVGWIALLASTAGMVLTGDIPLVILFILTENLHIGTAGIFGQMVTVVLMRSVSLILLMLTIFYLWVYIRRTRDKMIPDLSHE
jgi:hypothetical protein